MPLLRFFSPIIVAGLLFPVSAAVLKHSSKPEYTVYVTSKGIYSFKFNAGDLTAAVPAPAAEIPDPSYLAVHPGNKFLYTVSGSKNTISSYAIHKTTGALRLLNTVAARGVGSCYIVVDRKGWMLLVSNCATGNVESWRIAGDGAIGDPSDVRLQAAKDAHPNGITVTPDGFFLFVADRGLDKVFSYRFDPGRVIFWPNDPASETVKAGAGPRRLVFRPDEKFAYSVDETGSAVTAYTYKREAGSMKVLEAFSTLPEHFKGENTAGDIQMDPSGRFLYVSNCGDDSIVVFTINGKQGTLKPVQRIASQGQTPRNLRIDPAGQFLLAANEKSNTIAVFEIERKTGFLTPGGKAIPVPSPGCMQLVPVVETPASR